MFNPCCCEPCLFVEDPFDDADSSTLTGWDEESGDFEYSSGKLLCTSAGRCINTTDIAGSVACRVRATVNAGSSGDKVGLILFHRAADSKWWFAELTVDSGSSARVDFYEHVSGTDTLIGYRTGLTAANATDHTFQVSADLVSGNLMRLTVFLNGDKVLSSLRVRPNSTNTTRCGVISTSFSGTVTWDDFKVFRLREFGAECDEDNSCCFIPGPNDELRVVFSGYTNLLCSSCGSFNGTYILPHSSGTGCSSIYILSGSPAICGWNGLRGTLTDTGTGGLGNQGRCLVRIADNSNSARNAFVDIVQVPPIDYAGPWSISLTLGTSPSNTCNTGTATVEAI